MPLMIVAYPIAGLVLLFIGAETLLRAAARLAERFRLAPRIMGLGMAALVACAPRAAVSIQAALNDSGDIAVGTILGGNIASFLLTLGLCALIAPLGVSRQLLRLHLPMLIGASLLTYALAWDSVISRLDAALLFATATGYALLVPARGRREGRPGNRDPAMPPHRPGLRGWLTPLLLALVGLVLLLAGADLLVKGAESLARALGLSQRVIGLTVVAIGSNLPELTTSLLAVLRGQRDIAVGNAVGSCTLSLLGVTGLVALASPTGLSISPNALAFDFPVMLAVFIGCWPLFLSGHRLSRWKGALLLGYYLAYGLYLAMFATGFPAFGVFRHAMAWYALPLTAGLLLALLARGWRGR